MKDPNYTIGCITQLTDKGVQQTVDVFGDTMKRAVNVQSAQMEEGIRVKLIQLGWTPPASGTDKHTKHAEMNTSGETCIDSVPLPEPLFRSFMPATHNTAGHFVYSYTADQLRAYGDERARAIAEDRNCWKSIAEGEAELRAIADDELKVSESRVAELEAKLAEAEKEAVLYRTVRRQHWFQIAAADWVGLHGAKDLSERCPKLDDRIAAIAAGGGNDRN